MMKRTARAVDVPKLRRNLKNRGRIAETMCYGYLSGFAYVKLLLLWLVCIALDLIFGFRFELLYPVWLLIRNCYDSFRFQGLVSSFQYSAFSAFFVCATVTTDLICFVLLPVEVLLFLASTYVWLQFVLHTAERGVGCTQLLIWVVLILFEYNWRYRGDSPLYLLSGSTIGYAVDFINDGLLSSWLGLRDGPSTSTASGAASSRAECSSSRLSTSSTAGGMLGGFGVALTTAFAHSSSFGSELCRPFAAHCIGYPLVMLGFGLKAYLSLWRVRRRQREVSRENEVYCKLLTEALPSLYEGPKAYTRCNGTTLHEQDAAIDYETELSLPNLAICASPSGGSVLAPRKTSRASAAWKQHNGWKGTAGLNVAKRGAQSNGTVLSPRKDHINSSVNDDDDSASSASLSSAPRLTLWRMARDVLLGIFAFLIGGGGLGESGSLLDDRISVSSNEVESEEEMMEQEDNSSQADDFPLAAQSRLSSAQRANPKKAKGAARIKGGGRARGRNVQSHSEYLLPTVSSGSPLSASCTINNNILNLASGSSQHDKQLYSTPLNSTSGFQNGGVVSNEVYAAGSTSVSGKMDSVILEELENLRSELRASRAQENDLRCLLQQAVNSEKIAKGELAQIKAKHDQIDAKLSNLLKAREQDKSSMQLLEKRLIEAQAKKNELEKELSAEKRNKLKEEHAAARALAAAQSAKITDCGEACKAKKADLEREIRATRRDLKAKEELTSVYEEQLRQLREFKENNDIQELQSNLQAIQEKNHHLEQSLSAENRLKQDLFRVLTETRAQTEALQKQLCSKDIELMELRSQLSKDIGDSCKLSPTGNTARSTLPVMASASVVRMPSSVGLRLPSVNGCASSTNALKINNEQNMELLTAALSNAANNAYLPYSFNAHSGSGELLFDATVSNSVPGVNAPSSSSMSPPPAGPSSGLGVVGPAGGDAVCFNKFGVPSVPTTTSVRST